MSSSHKCAERLLCWQFSTKTTKTPQKHTIRQAWLHIFGNCRPQCNSVFIASLCPVWKVKCESTKAEGSSMTKRHRHVTIKAMLCSILRTCGTVSVIMRPFITIRKRLQNHTPENIRSYKLQLLDLCTINVIIVLIRCEVPMAEHICLMWVLGTLVQLGPHHLWSAMLYSLQ